MKFRLVKRARGWVVQKQLFATNAFDIPTIHGPWNDIGCWRYRWCALLHLLWLRERARK